MMFCKRIRRNGQVPAETEQHIREIKSDIGFAVKMMFCKRIRSIGHGTRQGTAENVESDRGNQI